MAIPHCFVLKINPDPRPHLSAMNLQGYNFISMLFVYVHRCLYVVWTRGRGGKGETCTTFHAYLLLILLFNHSIFGDVMSKSRGQTWQFFWKVVASPISPNMLILCDNEWLILVSDCFYLDHSRWVIFCALDTFLTKFLKLLGGLGVGHANPLVCFEIAQKVIKSIIIVAICWYS